MAPHGDTLKKDESIATVCSTEGADLRLPGVGDLPNADVVIFDGNCKFCCAQVIRLRWFDGGRLAYTSLHDGVVNELCPNLDKETLMKQMYVVNRQGDQYGGANALRYLSRKLPRLWLAAPLLHIPFSLPVWQFLYDSIAKRRYKISGKNSECDEGCGIHFEDRR